LDVIFIRALRLEAMIGIYRRERSTRQTVELDIDMALASRGVFESGRVADTIDYAVVAERIREMLATQRFGLVEELAEQVAAMILGRFGAPWTRVSVAKLGILKDAERVGIVIERSAAARLTGETP
jgi:dihydroneopterin aldolase